MAASLLATVAIASVTLVATGQVLISEIVEASASNKAIFITNRGSSSAVRAPTTRGCVSKTAGLAPPAPTPRGLAFDPLAKLDIHVSLIEAHVHTAVASHAGFHGAASWSAPFNACTYGICYVS
jgi:hypothetical protein